jgi:hypothetical protein
LSGRKPGPYRLWLRRVAVGDPCSEAYGTSGQPPVPGSGVLQCLGKPIAPPPQHLSPDVHSPSAVHSSPSAFPPSPSTATSEEVPSGLVSVAVVSALVESRAVSLAVVSLATVSPLVESVAVESVATLVSAFAESELPSVVADESPPAPPVSTSSGLVESELLQPLPRRSARVTVSEVSLAMRTSVPRLSLPHEGVRRHATQPVPYTARLLT